MYTKGEWRIIPVPEVHQPFLIGIGIGYNHPVATATKTHFPNEATANAHLIASAPDLYEACKLALEYFTEYDIQNKVISGLSLQLNKALAKAEGK